MKRIALLFSICIICLGFRDIHSPQIYEMATDDYDCKRSNCKYFYIKSKGAWNVFYIGFCSGNRYISCNTEYVIDVYSNNIERRDRPDSGFYQIDSNKIILRDHEFLKDTIMGTMVNNCVSYINSWVPRLSDTLLFSSDSLWLRGEFYLQPISFDSLNALLNDINTQHNKKHGNLSKQLNSTHK